MSDVEDNTELDLLLETLEADEDSFDGGDNLASEKLDDDSFITCDSRFNKTSVSTMDGTFCSAASTMHTDDSFRTVNGDMNDTYEDDTTPEPHIESPDFLSNEKESTASPNNGNSQKKVSAKIVPIDFGMQPKPKVDEYSAVLFGSDSEDDDLIEKENLNESGRNIKKSISSRFREEEKSKPLPCPSNYKTPSSSVQKSVLTGLSDQSEPAIESVAFDKFFNIKIRNPKVSSMAFETLTDGMRKIRASDIRYGLKDKFVTIGVIVDKSEVKKSANGKDYVMWRIHDLKDCQTQSLKVLLFGECCKENWKLQAGTAIGLIAPEVGDPPKESKDKQVAARVFKKAQVMELGFCPSYGICRAIKNDSQKCTNFVNMDISEFCMYHVMSQVRSLSSKRGTFNNISGAPAKKRQPSNPQNGLLINKPTSQKLQNGKFSIESDTVKVSSTFAPVASTAKTTTKTEEKETLTQLMTSRSHLMGARNLMKLTGDKDVKPTAITAKHTSMADFMKERMIAEAKTQSPQLGSGMSRGVISLTNTRKRLSTDHEAARQRAIELYKKSKEKKAATPTISQPKKRSATDSNNEDTPSKKTKIGTASKEDIERILQRKFLSDKAADKEEHTAVEKYLDNMEKREKVETVVTTCMSLKNVKVYSCKKCNYTAQKRSDLCLRNGHAVTEHMAEKRFFKCKGCNRREIAYGVLPNKPCQGCDSNNWERVALRDERRVKLDNEQLKVRGDEQKFVNR